MNKLRRESIQHVITDLENLRVTINNLWDEEQDAFDNLPEGLQSSERGEAMENAAYNLEEACEGLASVIESLEEAAV